MSQAPTGSAQPIGRKPTSRAGAKASSGGKARAHATAATKTRISGDGGGQGRGGAAQASLYEAVTQRIVGELEAGRLPWVQPWGTSGGAAVGLPRNAATKRPYAGINILILWGAVIQHAFPSQDWLTFAQAQNAGGAVQNGARGVTVVYADRFTPEDEKRRAAETGDDARFIPFLKRFTLFNLAQCDGLSGLAADPTALGTREIMAVGEDLIRTSGVDYPVGGDEAFYAPIFDFVQVPPQPAFFAQIDYYRTAFHELTHATGHASRLGRDLSHGFGSTGYAREELVAEMGSAFLCAALGIVPTVRHADYLAGWLDLLRQDTRAIFRAASQASKAADWLLARLKATRAEAAS